MENNEKNLQNEVNTEQNVSNVKKNDKKKTIVLVVIVLILVLILGVCIGAIAFTKNKETTVVKETDKQTEVKEETKMSKKVDESKEWVYDADYHKGKTDKTVSTLSRGITYKSSEQLKLPFINVNSDYANSINEEISNLFNKSYKVYGEAYPEKNVQNECLISYSYTYTVKENVLSVYIEEHVGYVNGEYNITYYTYNINLDTLGRASLEDVYKACGFSTEYELLEKINISIANGADENKVSKNASWKDKICYIDKNGKLNIIVDKRLVVDEGDYGTLVIEKSVVRNSEKSDNTNQNQTPSNTKTDVNETENIQLFVKKWETVPADTELIIYENGSFVTDHYNKSSEIHGKCKVDGNSIELITDDGKKWQGQLLKQSDETVLNVNMDGSNITFYDMEYKRNKTVTLIGKNDINNSQFVTTNNTYTVTYSNKEGKIESIHVDTLVSGCGVSSSTNISDIKVTSTDVAAGTQYIYFDFTGNETITDYVNGNKTAKCEGTGILTISGDGYVRNYGLKLSFNNPILKATYNETEFDISGSIDNFMDLKEK